MRVFAVSDVHLDYQENTQWLANLSDIEYQSDILILAGDISDDLVRIEWCFSTLRRKFAKVFFVPGNHDLWVRRNPGMTSIDKFRLLDRVAADHQICTDVYHCGALSIVPMFSWYDYSFGMPCEQLLRVWADYHVCHWPGDMGVEDVSSHFLDLNRSVLPVQNEVVISFSHFMPRIDLLPETIPQHFRYIYPVLGSSNLDIQCRTIQAHRHLHVYGHSHLNRNIILDDIEYINNAFGYPHERSISRKKIIKIYED